MTEPMDTRMGWVLPWAVRWTLRVVLAAALVGRGLVAAPSHAADTHLSNEEEAAALSVVAKKKADVGEFVVAAEMYMQAWQSFPKESGYLYSAARCWHRAARWAEAEKSYAEFVRVAPADHSQRGKAMRFQEEVRRISTDEVARQKALDDMRQEQAKLAQERQQLHDQHQEAARTEAARVAAQKELHTKLNSSSSDSSSLKKTGGLVTAAGGAVLVGIGGWLVLSGVWAGTHLQRDLDTKDASGKIVGIDRETALDVRKAAVSVQALGGVLMLLGAVGGGVGAWLVLDSRSSVGVAPAADGLALTLRF
ncbi:MAG: hypothetical protein EXR77_02535 [Myxococcales bacterium]|nr:hypothetical protein [Myxococcales bacterium]